MTTARPWGGQPYLNELRPAPGWRVDLALFATYSIDLSALGATLLALCGRNDDDGSGSIADFAEAIEALRGRAHFLVQRGRIARPSRLPTLAGILDQFVVEVPHDEALHSWHPKVALIRYLREGVTGHGKASRHETRWRLWLGSRNLTRAADLDAGLLLETAPGGRPKRHRIEGLGRVAEALAEHAKLGGDDVREIVQAMRDAVWAVPEGMTVPRIEWIEKGVPMRAVAEDEKIDAVTIVSPFLDATFLKTAAKWGGRHTQRTLVSTRPALLAVAQSSRSPLERFDRLLTLDAPDPPLDVVDSPAETLPPVASGDDEEPTMPALHAKLFCFERGARATLLVGSANATSRAWQGRNTEVLAELVGPSAMIEGLAYLVSVSKPVTLDELASAPPPGPTVRDELELARRKLVSEWAPRLTREGPAFTVEAVVPEEILSADIALAVGLAATELLVWPSGAAEVSLGDVPLARQTDLLRCELRSGDMAVAWMQRAPVIPVLDPERDATALAELMGFGAFQGWMRQLLSEDLMRNQGELWDARPEGRTPTRGENDFDLLTLEDIVGSWGADKRRFRRADQHFERYCDALLRQDVLNDADRSALNELRAIWRLARMRLPI